MSTCYDDPVLELAILGLLKERPMHGYDLRKQLRGDSGLFANLSFGSVYPTLARLESSGAIRSTAVRAGAEQPGSGRAERELTGESLLATGSLAGERAALRARRPAIGLVARSSRGTRGRKVYEITSRGRVLFEELLVGSMARDEDDKVFALRLSFARHLTATQRTELFARHRARLAERLSAARDALDRAAEADRYLRAVLEHRRRMLEADLAWIDELAAAEQTEHGQAHDEHRRAPSPQLR
jgi:DNA-binding PadR family transcriptional regulator